MKIKNLIFIVFATLFLNGCVLSAGLFGPAFTVASTGNVYQGAFTYGSSQVIKKETGKDTISYVTDLLDINNKKEKTEKTNKRNKDSVILVKNNILETRSKLLTED